QQQRHHVAVGDDPFRDAWWIFFFHRSLPFACPEVTARSFSYTR
ncbi:MAG: hypothetical protein ACI92S_005237, partial [Planctomycetaceae bacterium]